MSIDRAIFRGAKRKSTFRSIAIDDEEVDFTDGLPTFTLAAMKRS